MKHFYEGERCVFCNYNIYDAYDDNCSERENREPLSYSTNTNDILEKTVFTLDYSSEHLVFNAIEDNNKKAIIELFYNDDKSTWNIFIKNIEPFYKLHVDIKGNKLVFEHKPNTVFEFSNVHYY